MFVKKNYYNEILIAAVILIASSHCIAQVSTKEKLNNIKDDVDKITITAGDEKITFEGDEAKDLFKKMQASRKSVNSFVIKEHGDISGMSKIIIKSDGDVDIYDFNEESGDHMVWFCDEGELSNMGKRIEVDIENGQKKVTVTTKVNGEEKNLVL